ncbi:unnamed protein product [Spirodela intermedia]|uniref:Uncharacterized protein n=1 Tax=Spirodela intermedia TaxID=51605 RepID=A0A7I8LMJ4_SPIIN|nr:unnamed protein product [Spirodela intermedia]
MKSDTTPTNWMLVVSAALLSALAVRLRCRLRQAFGGDSSGISEARRADIKAAQARPSWSEGTDTELPPVAAPAAERVKDRDGGGGGVVRATRTPRRVRVGFRRRAPAGGGAEEAARAAPAAGRDDFGDAGPGRREEARSAHLRSQLDRAGTRLAQSKGELLRLRREAADLKLLTNGWARVPSYGKLRNK